MTVWAMLLAAVLTGSVEGRVTGPEGVPIASARVSVVGREAGALTGPDGRFRIGDLPAGRWRLVVRARGFEELSVGVRVDDGGTVRLDVELTPVRGRADEASRAVEVRGVVQDGARLEPVPGARVDAGGGREATTGDDGTFTLPLPPGAWLLRVEAPGYRPREQSVRVVGGVGRPLELFLELQPVALPGLAVAGAPPGVARVAADVLHTPSARVLDSTFVRLSPTTVERDILRAVQALPSVTPSSDYSTALFVRGGTPDQTRLFLDGTPLYNPFHVAGFAAAFAPEAVGSSVLSPGGLPASSPAALSGVLEVRTVDPEPDSAWLAGGLGLLSSSATWAGPLPGARGALVVSGRRTYVDAASSLAETLGLAPDVIPYGFTDGLFKARLDGERGSLALSGYLNREAFRVDEPDSHDVVDARWGTDLLALRGRYAWSDGLVLSGGVGTSGFGGDLFVAQRRFGLDSPSDLLVDTTVAHTDLRSVSGDAALRADLGAHLTTVGLRVEGARHDHAFVLDPDEDLEVPDFTAGGRTGTVAVFARDRWRTGSSLTLDGGVRLERPRGRGWVALPRGRIEWDGPGSLGIALAGGRYLQDWWSLRDEESLAATVVAYDLLVPVPRGRPLPTSRDLVLELRGRWAGWRLGADLFQRRMSDVPTARPHIDPVNVDFLLDRDSVRLGRGTVTGLELSAAGRWGTADLAAAYRWQRERRTLEGLEFTPRTDRRHSLVVSAARPFWGERVLALSATWRSGIPLTPARGAVSGLRGVDAEGRPVHGSGSGRVVFGELNSRRLPSYLRIDLETRGAWDLTLFGHRGLIEPYVSVLNVLNRHNVLAAEHHHGPAGVIQDLAPQLPVFPSFGIRWRF